MSFKRTESLEIEEPMPVDHNQSENMMAGVNQSSKISQHAASVAMNKSQRMPLALQKTLRQTKQLQVGLFAKKKSEQAGMQSSKLGSMFRSKLKDMRNMVNCQICDEEFKKSDSQLSMCECEHKFNFCQSCMHHYVIYKVKMFEEVYCPREGCQVLLNIQGQFFKQLPADIQKNYKKLHQFYVTSKDSSKKLCPRQNCEGLISMTAEEVMACDTCKSQFCPSCLLARHQGKCDEHEVEFFQNNLHYRQCKKCKFIIEKNQGCNHMTCRCGYQFCYVCTADWGPAHYGNHDQNGNLIVTNPGTQANAGYEQDDCCNCNCECNCECLDECPFLTCLLKLPFKLLLFTLYICLMVLLFCCRDLIILTGVTLMTLFAGIFGFSFELVCDMDGLAFILSLIFFPIFMIGGIGLAFRQIFCDIAPSLCSSFCEIVGDGMTAIAQI